MTIAALFTLPVGVGASASIDLAGTGAVNPMKTLLYANGAADDETVFEISNDNVTWEDFPNSRFEGPETVLRTDISARYFRVRRIIATSGASAKASIATESATDVPGLQGGAWLNNDFSIRAADVTLDANNDAGVVVDSGALARNVTLPPAAAGVETGKAEMLSISRRGANAVQITPDGTDTINGVNAPITLLQSGDSVQLCRESSTGWRIVGGAYAGGKLSFHGALLPNSFPTTAALSPQLTTQFGYQADCTLNSVDVQLPAASSAGATDVSYAIKRIDAGAFNCTITPNGADGIDGKGEYLLRKGDAVILRSDGASQWRVIGTATTNDVTVNTKMNGPVGALPNQPMEDNGGITPVAAPQYRAGFLIDAAAGNIVVNLPPTGDLGDIAYVFTRKAESAFRIDITPDGADTINGVAAPFTGLINQDSVILKRVAGSTDWRIISDAKTYVGALQGQPENNASPFAVLPLHPSKELIIADAGGNTDFTMPSASTYRLHAVDVIKTGGAGGVGDSIQVFNGAAAVSDVISLNGLNAGDLAYAVFLDAVNGVFAAGGTLRVTAVKAAGDVSCIVTFDFTRLT